MGIRESNRAEFEHTAVALAPRMRAVAQRILRDPDEAEDAVQDALLAAHRNLASFQQRSQLATWLHRIVVNAALMRYRKRQRRSEILSEVGPPLPTATCSQSQHLAREALDETAGCLEALPVSYREILHLRGIQEMEIPEIAAALGKTPNAVKTRLHRARRALRRELERVDLALD